MPKHQKCTTHFLRSTANSIKLFSLKISYFTTSVNTAIKINRNKVINRTPTPIESETRLVANNNNDVRIN